MAILYIFTYDTYSSTTRVLQVYAIRIIAILIACYCNTHVYSMVLHAPVLQYYQYTVYFNIVNLAIPILLQYAGMAMCHLLQYNIYGQQFNTAVLAIATT